MDKHSISPQQEYNTFVDIIQKRTHHQPDRVAYTLLLNGEVEDGSFTYGELDQQPRAIAVSLQGNTNQMMGNTSICIAGGLALRKNLYQVQG